MMKWLDRWRDRQAANEHDLEETDPEVSRLLDRSRSLLRELTPERDLWNGIENQISRRVASSEPSGWSLGALFPRPLAAGAVAVLLVATTALSVLWITEGPGALPSDAEIAAMAKEIRERDGVSGVHENIVAILDAHRATLPSETIALLDENLRSIDRAIAEIQLALETNPDHHALSFLLAEAYRSEAELLERLEWWLQAPPEVNS